MYQTKNLGLNITEIEKDTLSAFNFDTDLGDNFKAIDEKTLSHRNITNCLLEVPQDIKLEIVDGVITLKEGSKVYVPNGPGIFEEVNINSDISFEQPPYDGVYMLFINPSGNIQRNLSTLCFSGSTAPTNISNYTFWYDTTNNLVKFTTNGGANWEEGYSLPFCIVTAVANTSVSIDQVFNGFGYIGSTVFALPGVKCLIPNGRNEDGSFKSDLFTSTTVKIHSATSDYSNPTATMVFDSLGNIGVHKYFEGDEIPTNIGYAWVYHRPSNLTLQWNETESKYLPTATQFVYLADVNVASGQIKSLTPKLPFHAVDYNDYQTKITELETKIATLEAAVKALQGS